MLALNIYGSPSYDGVTNLRMAGNMKHFVALSCSMAIFSVSDSFDCQGQDRINNSGHGTSRSSIMSDFTTSPESLIWIVNAVWMFSSNLWSSVNPYMHAR